MTILGIDIGSSSVKAGLLRGERVVGRISRAEIETRYDGTHAEVNANDVLGAVARAVRQLPRREVDVIALSTMSPSWVAMDKRGRAITPIVTHQDRRSVAIARQLEARVGKQRHLKLAGNRPFPGGISSTTCAWFLRHERALMRRADLVGHLSTFVHRQITGSRVIDPSQASFTGLYRTMDLAGWSEELCEAIGLSTHALPQVLGSEEIGGLLTRDGARRLGVRHGTPVITGLTDTGSAMLLAGGRPGQLVNVSGSTDVLALCTDRPRAHERLLTRALGVGRLWLSVATQAAAGSSLSWVREQFFRDVSRDRFRGLVRQLARERTPSAVEFEPYLAGERTSLEQRTGALRGLTLATTREDVLRAVMLALARDSAERLDLLRRANSITIRRRVSLSGGVTESWGDILHRNWKGKWSFRVEPEATLRGLARVAPA